LNDPKKVELIDGYMATKMSDEDRDTKWHI
jgi:hypothetical protein